MAAGSRALPAEARVELNGVQYLAVAEPDPPHRLAGLRGLPTGVRDRRTHVILSSRMIPVNFIDVQLQRAWTNPA